MKKTVSVNIKGTNFLVEEDAYELLQDYLDRLNVLLQNEEGSQEIIEDIELRVAEICTSKLNDIKTVIELRDIEEILKALGDPEKYVDGDEDFDHKNDYTKSNFSSEKTDRRLFRDVDSATLGGVCAGIAGYFGIDVVIIRAIFVILGIFGGFGIPLYIILWVIIPKAETTIDRLRMKGRPITVETVKDEVENAAEKIRSGSKSFASKVRGDQSYDKRINRGKNIFRNLLAFGFITGGILFLTGFILFFVQGFEFLPVKGDQGFMSITEFGELTLSSPADVEWMWIGGLTASISGILFLFSMGTLIFFRLFNQWTKIAIFTLLAAIVTGGLICASMGIRAGRDWVNDEEVLNQFHQTVDTDALIMVPEINSSNSKSGYTVRKSRTAGYFGIEGDYLTKRGIDIEYSVSPDSLFHIKQAFRAHGESSRKAIKRSEHIKHQVKIKGDTVHFDVKYRFPIKDKLRGQQAILIIEVPQGKKVVFPHDVIDLEVPDPRFEEGHNNFRKEGRIDKEGHYHHDY